MFPRIIQDKQLVQYLWLLTQVMQEAEEFLLEF